MKIKNVLLIFVIGVSCANDPTIDPTDELRQDQEVDTHIPGNPDCPLVTGGWACRAIGYLAGIDSVDAGLRCQYPDIQGRIHEVQEMGGDLRIVKYDYITGTFSTHDAAAAAARKGVWPVYDTARCQRVDSLGRTPSTPMHGSIPSVDCAQIQGTP